MTSEAMLKASGGQPVDPPAGRLWGEYRAHGHLSTQNVVNGLLCLFALFPSIIVTAMLYTKCPVDADTSSADFPSACCNLALRNPVAMANVLFFVNVCVGFWIVGLIQRNFWLIDPYWTIIPPLLVHFYQLNPLASSLPARSVIAVALIWVWSIRLTYSYFRREEWKFGQREDWRYTKMARDLGGWWWVLSFFAVGVAQQPMLVGVTLPAYIVHRSDLPWNSVDTLAVAVAVGGLLLAYVADNQLFAYMQRNEALTRSGQPKVPLFNTGLWGYSRHPNYLGETLWWLGYGLFAVRLGQWWMLGGWVINTATLITVTTMTEQRMIKGWTEERVALYRRYQRETPAWIPLPGLGARGGGGARE